MTELRIIFMGTPDFAVASLEILLEHHFNVVAVVTAADKPKGRGQKLVHTPVKACAMRHGIPILQPVNLKSAEFIETLSGYAADLQVVVAFRMLPEAVWSMPPLGTINLHASLLPQYRGAAPIHWAIINGETETGVTTFLLQHEIDTGRILFQEREPIHDNDTVGELYSRLQEKGARLVLRTVQALQSGLQAPSSIRLPCPGPTAVRRKSFSGSFQRYCWPWRRPMIGEFVGHLPEKGGKFLFNRILYLD
jgi:methionyl-tRNA formyltransferase